MAQKSIKRQRKIKLSNKRISFPSIKVTANQISINCFNKEFIKNVENIYNKYGKEIRNYLPEPGMKKTDDPAVILEWILKLANAISDYEFFYKKIENDYELVKSKVYFELNEFYFISYSSLKNNCELGARCIYTLLSDKFKENCYLQNPSFCPYLDEFEYMYKNKNVREAINNFGVEMCKEMRSWIQNVPKTVSNKEIIKYINGNNFYSSICAEIIELDFTCFDKFVNPIDDEQIHPTQLFGIVYDYGTYYEWCAESINESIMNCSSSPTLAIIKSSPNSIIENDLPDYTNQIKNIIRVYDKLLGYYH